MKHKKYLFTISLLISLLIILIPIAIATEINTYDNLALKTKEQKIKLYQSPEDEVIVAPASREPFERDYLSDPGKACVSQHEETSSFANNLDTGVIATLEKIASILFAICTTMSAIDMVISAVSFAIGMLGGVCCWGAPEPTSVTRCAATQVKFTAWSAVYSTVQPLCCFVNCGWCTGAGCFSILGVNLASISLGAIPGGGIGQFGLSPYDNIYLAIGCLCPIAIIFNMRKLKTVYDVYDCCIQEACENGLSTDACERQLDEATCMYWEGSLYNIVAKILISILTGIVASKLAEVFGLSLLLACFYALLKMAQVPKVISNVNSAWKYMSRTFNKPKCEDLGFKDIKEEILEDWEYVTLVDKDDDGIYDYSSPEWTKIDDKTSTTTLRLPTKDGGYELKTFTKKDGEIYEGDKKVSTLKWQELKGSSEPARINFAPDGSASIGYILYDKVEVKNNKITFTGTDEKGKQISETFDLTKPSETQYIANNLGLDQYELGEVTGGEGGNIKFKNGEVKIVNLGDKDKSQVLEINPTDKKPITETRYHEGSILATSEKSVTFTSKKGAKIEIQQDTTLFDALKNPDTTKSAKDAISTAIEAGWDEQEIQTATLFDDGRLESKRGSKIIRLTSKGESQVEDTATIEGTRISQTITTDPKTGTSRVMFEKEDKKLTLPQELAKDINKENILFDESNPNLIWVKRGDKFDVYETVEVGNTKMTTKLADVQFKMDETYAGGKKEQCIISSQDGNTGVSPEVITKLVSLSGVEKIQDVSEERILTLQNAYQKFDGEVTSENLRIEGERVVITYEKIQEKIDARGSYEKFEDGKRTEVELIYSNGNRETATGEDIQLDSQGRIDLSQSQLKDSTILSPEGTIKSTTHRLNDGQLVESRFVDENQEISIGLKEVWQPDKEGNLVGKYEASSLQYTAEGDLQIKKGDEWVNYDSKTLTTLEKAQAVKGILPDDHPLKDELNNLDNLKTKAEKESALREMEEEINQFTAEKEKSMKAVAKQVEEDKKTAEKAAEKVKKEAVTKDKETVARKELEQKAAYQMMYEILWTALDYTLGEEVDDFVENKCKEDAGKSYPPSDTPTDSGGSQGCEDVYNNTYNAQFISRTQSNGNCEYKVSYALTACNHSVDFTVQLAGTGKSENIEGGSLPLEGIISRNRIIISSVCTHERVCIIIKGETTKCFPP